MKHMKRILSFALVLVMVLSCMPIQALAAENAETAYVAINKTTGKGYESLLVAMSECRKGETVALQKDASEMQVLVPADGILDLNGCTLEAEYMSCFGDLIDSSEDNSGLLKVNEDYFLVRGDNKQLPIKDGTGFRFVEITKINTKMLTPTKFVFQPLFEAAALDLIAKGGDITGLTVQVLVSWKQNDGYRTQKFVYNDDLLTQFLGSYNAATGKYGKMFTLTLNNVDGIEELSFAAVLASSTKVTISSNDPVEEETEEIFSASTNLDKNDLIYGTLANEVTLSGTTGVSAVVPAAVKVENGAAALALSVKKAETGSEITLGEGESAQSLDVHIAGVAADNKVPMIVNLGAILEKGLSDTELKLYHTENGVAVLMTRVASAADFAIHNQYTYNPETGEVSIYVASFSVFSAVQATVDEWDGTADIDWYNENDTEFTLTTAEQFAGFRVLVDGGNTFEGKTIKLGVDIDLKGIQFDPIGFGYYNAETNTRVFMGTFDGQNHTVYNLAQNCWELGADKYTYSTAGGGLFASIKDATIKNLAVSGAKIVFECVDMGIVVGYAQGTCHFENIVVTNSTIANYNRSTGAVVGEVCYGPYGTDVSQGYSHTFKNITVDSSVTVSSLWGSFDTSCGGVIGGKWGDATVKMENITVAAKLDVFSDVTAAYQWYAYRRCGMLIGYTEQESPKKALNAAAEFLTCSDVEVYYGDWVNYTYYEFADQDSDTGKRYPWVRAEEGLHNDAFSNPRYGVPEHTVNGVKVKVNAQNATDHMTCDKPVTITFGQLYGGGQGVYGTNEHAAGVTIYNKDTKIVYIYDANETEDLKLQYWFKNGNDVWSTFIEGIDMGDMYLGNGVYRVELPAYAYAFKITGTNAPANDILVANVVEGATYMLDGTKHEHEYDANGKCDCGAMKQLKEIEFTFGANGNKTHYDGAELADEVATTWTEEGYTLKLTEWDKVYGSAHDKLGNSGLKLGTGSSMGSFAFTVPEDVTKVIIEVAKYKTNASAIEVNGTSYTLTKNSDDGEYDEIEVDTTTNKTVEFTTVSTGKRCMINTIIFCVEEMTEVHKCDQEVVLEGKDATCTETGLTNGAKCSICGAVTVEQEVIEALGHDWSEWTGSEPTCTEAGVKTRTCATCGEKETETTEATGHSYDWDTTQTATCTEDGEKVGTCACGDTKTETIEATGHDFVDGKCSACGEAEVAYTVTFDVPNGVTAPTGWENGTALPGVNNVPAGYTFVGWTVEPIEGTTTELPAILKTGEEYTATEDVTLYAVFSFGEEVAGGWVQKDIADITATDVVVITMSTSTTMYALPNDGGASTPTAIVIASLADVAENLKWNIVKDGDKLEIYPNGISNKWLYCTSTNAGVRVGTDGDKVFTIDASSGYLKHINTSRYVGVYTNNPDWRCYTNTTGNTAGQTLAFYVYSAGNSVEYVTDICDHSNTTTTTEAATCTEAGSTTVTCDDCSATVSITEIPATGHVNTTTTTVDATCTEAGSITVTCACGHVVSTETIEALGHTTENGTCERCEETIGGSTTPAEPQKLATFEFGDNGSAGHVDGSEKTTYTENNNGYTLSVTGGTNMYTGARDATGNSCIKLGTSKKAGSFSFTVDENVTSVTIYVAKYKTNAASVKVNGTTTTLTKNSNEGNYDIITIDTSTTKTVSFAVSSGYRAMVNAIVFTGYAK